MTPSNANRADLDQAALLRQLSDQGLLCLLIEILLDDPTLVNLAVISLFYVHK